MTKTVRPYNVGYWAPDTPLEHLVCRLVGAWARRDQSGPGKSHSFFTTKWAVKTGGDINWSPWCVDHGYVIFMAIGCLVREVWAFKVDTSFSVSSKLALLPPNYTLLLLNSSPLLGGENFLSECWVSSKNMLICRLSWQWRWCKTLHRLGHNIFQKLQISENHGRMQPLYLLGQKQAIWHSWTLKP